MSVLDDIESLTQRIDRLLEDIPLRTEDVSDAAVEAVLRLLDDQDLSTLSTARLDTVIQEALQDATRQLGRQTRSVVEDRVKDLVSATTDFYDSVGVDIPASVTTAVRRRQASQRVTDALRNGLSIASEDLKKATIDAVEAELASSGSPSRQAIQEAIEEAAEASTHVAQTQARTSINAYNQTYKDELANQTGLDRFLYAGNLQSNSRRFCIAHVDGVYTRDQIRQMKNGQIEPVITFCGGYNCRHSWVPVDPSWDDELKKREVPESRDPLSYGDGDRTATIVPTDPQS